MPIVEDGALSLGDSVLWETFHTRANKTYQPEGSESILRQTLTLLLST
jgi:hypothetical protein